MHYFPQDNKQIYKEEVIIDKKGLNQLRKKIIKEEAIRENVTGKTKKPECSPYIIELKEGIVTPIYFSPHSRPYTIYQYVKLIVPNTVLIIDRLLKDDESVINELYYTEIDDYSDEISSKILEIFDNSELNGIEYCIERFKTLILDEIIEERKKEYSELNGIEYYIERFKTLILDEITEKRKKEYSEIKKFIKFIPSNVITDGEVEKYESFFDIPKSNSRKRIKE